METIGIRHFVFIEFEDCEACAEYCAAIKSAMEEAKSTVDGFIEYNFMIDGSRNTERRKLLIELSYTGESALKDYLSSPAHKVMLSELKDKPHSIATFDR